MFSSIISGASSGLALTQILICFAASLICGTAIALTYRACGHPSKNFCITAAILPAIVQIVILMVNGNLGVGVAVAGSFALVRFRSLPGKGSDIAVVFMCMGIGLATGMGYVGFAFLAALILCGAFFLFSKTNLFPTDDSSRYLRIMIPEDLDYAGAFDDIFTKYAVHVREESVRTVNLGTMYQLSYDLQMKKDAEEKKMVDEIRCRNGNLTVICSRHEPAAGEL